MTILGISNSHDSGAAILQDGKILCAVNQERLSRVKVDGSFPLQAINEVMRISGVSADKIDFVGVTGSALGGGPAVDNDCSIPEGETRHTQIIAEGIDRIPFSKGLFTNRMTVAGFRLSLGLLARVRTARIAKILSNSHIHAPISWFDHHDSHIASAYYASGFQNCLIFSNDAFGEGLCSKVVYAEIVDGLVRFTELSQNSFYNSLGQYYSYATYLCGFNKQHHAGKTTGLAALGDSRKTEEIFKSIITWNQDRGIYENHGGLFRNSIAKLERDLRGMSREDIAAGIQCLTEKLLVSQVAHYLALTGCKNIALVGGLHANVKANQKIAEIPGVRKVYVFPHMGDGGLSLGAAYLTWAKQEPRMARSFRLEHVYFGSDCGPQEERIKLVKEAGLSYSIPHVMAVDVARLLSENRIVARCAGRMEYGPRALGNRSMLYPATDAKVNHWLNVQLKRTEFMPFAPVVREEDAAAYFENYDDKTQETAEFMTITFRVTPQCQAEAPAIVHVDGTARPQIIRREVNPDYYDILTEYKKLTGRCILVNTSFNMHEEPIVCSAADAVRAFCASGVDALILQDLLVRSAPR